MHQSLTALINSVFSFLYRTAIFVAVILLCFHFLVLSATPSVVVSSAQQVENAQSVNVLLNDVSKVLYQKQFEHDITISEAQGQSLLGFMQRAYPSFSGNIHFNQHIGVLEISIKVPQWIVPRYMNIQLILNSNSYVDIEGLKVGKIPLPGNALLKIATWLVNTYTRSSIATQAQTQINGVRFSPDNVFVSILPMKQFLNDLKVVRDSIDFGSDPSLGLRINHYLHFLMNEQSVPKSRFNSLAVYITEVMLEAQIQSSPETAHLENEAAILALAIYAANPRFANLLGVIPPQKQQVLYGDFTPALALRKDLSQHFIYSAAIKLLSNQGVTVAIGEFKELMDRVSAGSGYSFVDLAADKAGVYFADYLTDPETAFLAQSRLAQSVNEALFFPTIEHLPEGLNTDAFIQTFTAVDSPEYQAMITDITARLKQLPLYQ